MLNLKVFNYQIGEFQEKILTPNMAQREWMIGRADTCDLVLAAPEVSRVHGRIGYHEGQYYFSDLGSTDGSHVNNETARVKAKYALKKRRYYPHRRFYLGDSRDGKQSFPSSF